MRTADTALITAQKSYTITPNIQLQLIKAGNTMTYGEDRILDLRHFERAPNDYYAICTLNNSDKHFETNPYLNLYGANAEISWGVGTALSAAAPLKVIEQHFNSSPGRLTVDVVMSGLLNIMDREEATEDYQEPTASTVTVKDQIIALAMGGTAGYKFDAYNSYLAFTVAWDSEDEVIDSFIPGDSFTIYQGESRYRKIKELLDLTSCVMRLGGDGQLHVFVPRISGDTWQASYAYVLHDYVQSALPDYNFTYECTQAGFSGVAEPTWPTTDGQTVNDGTAIWTCRAFDYEYNNTASTANHAFYAKSRVQRVVMPNYIVVQSPDGVYAGTAAHSDSALIRLDHYEIVDVASTAMASSIATAMLLQGKRQTDQGNIIAPINCGQELYDYVKVTDSREADFKIGHVAYVERHYSNNPVDWSMEIQLGEVGLRRV